jgi:hypothetical protein
LLQRLAFCAEILPIILYPIFLKRNRGTGLWVIFLYCVLSFVTEFFLGVFRGAPVQKNLVYFAFTLIEFTLFSLFFFLSLREKRFRYIPIIGAILFYVVAIVNVLNSNLASANEHPFDSLPASVESILIISYCILLLYEQIKDPEIVFVYTTKKFWIIIAFFLYFSSTLFLFIYAGSLTEQQRSNYWGINNFFEILKNILFCISFIMKKHYVNPYATDSLES